MTIDNGRLLDNLLVMADDPVTSIPIPGTIQRSPSSKKKLSAASLKGRNSDAGFRRKREVSTDHLRAGWYAKELSERSPDFKADLKADLRADLRVDVRADSRKSKFHPLFETSDDECCSELEDLLSDCSLSDSEEEMTLNSSLSASNFSSFQTDSYISIPMKSCSDSRISPIRVLSSVGMSKSAESSQELSKILRNYREPPQKSNFTSNLSSSLKSFTSMVWKPRAHINPYSIIPRATDDHIPQSNVSPTHVNSLEKELTTFSGNTDSETATLPVPPRKAFKTREQRVNAFFLRLYAHDYNARLNGALPSSYKTDDIENLVQTKPSFQKFHNQFNVVYISDLSHDKLWRNVILPPRDDLSPKNYVDHSNYIYIGDDQPVSKSQVISSKSNVIPWSSSKRSFKPAGILETSKQLENGILPSSGVTRSQFTSRSWCNRRWIDCSQKIDN